MPSETDTIDFGQPSIQYGSFDAGISRGDAIIDDLDILACAQSLTQIGQTEYTTALDTLTNTFTLDAAVGVVSAYITANIDTPLDALPDLFERVEYVYYRIGHGEEGGTQLSDSESQAVKGMFDSIHKATKKNTGKVLRKSHIGILFFRFCTAQISHPLELSALRIFFIRFVKTK